MSQILLFSRMSLNFANILCLLNLSDLRYSGQHLLFSLSYLLCQKYYIIDNVFSFFNPLKCSVGIMDLRNTVL